MLHRLHAPSSGSFSREALLNGLHQAFAFWAGHAVVAVNELAVSADQVFVKVPLGPLTRVLSQLFEKGHRRIARDGRFSEHGKLHAKRVFAKISNVLVVCFFLCEVVRRKTQNNQALVFVLAVNGL